MMKIEFRTRSETPLPSGPSSARLDLRRSITTYCSWVAVIVLVAILWLPRLSGPLDLRWDGGVYYLLGTSLNSGHGYRILSEPGWPRAIQYPPLLPVFVALHQRALSTSDPAVVAPWLRKSYAAMFLLFGLTLLAVARRFLPDPFAFVAVALCLCLLMTVFMSDLLFAELPFALLTVLFVFVATSETWPIWVHESLTFTVGAAGFFLRTAGVALLGAWVLDALIRRQWRAMVLRAGLSLLPVLVWQSYVTKVRSSAEYSHPAYEYQRAPYQFYNVSYAENIALVDPFQPEHGRIHLSTLVNRLVGNLVPMFTAIGQSVSARNDVWSQLLGRVAQALRMQKLLPPKTGLVPVFALSALTLLGLAMFIQRRAWLVVFIILLSLALTLVTPWPSQFNRYLMPSAPLLAICAVHGWRSTWSSLARRSRLFLSARIALAAFSALVVLIQPYALFKGFHERVDNLPPFASGKPNSASTRLFNHTDAWLSWEQAVEWLRQNASPQAIIATEAPHFFYLLTGRQSVLPPLESDPHRAEALLAAVPVRYVIIDQLGFVGASWRYARPAVESNPMGWRLAYSREGTEIYERTGARQ